MSANGSLFQSVHKGFGDDVEEGRGGGGPLEDPVNYRAACAPVIAELLSAVFFIIGM